MTTKFKQNLSNPSQTYRPYILHGAQVAQNIPGDFRKRCYKHIHSFIIRPKSRSFLNRIPLPKTLHSIDLQNWWPGKDLRFVKKLVKPFKKSLRDLQGAASHPKIQKLVPLLTNIRVPLTQEAFRVLALHSDIKKLHFDIPVIFRRRINGEELLKKFKAPFSRKLAKIKDLRTLLMDVARQEVLAAKLLLEMIDQNVPLQSMKKFSLELESDISPFHLKEFHEQKERKSSILGKLTHLSCDDSTWCSFLTSGNPINLFALKLEPFSKGTPSELKDFFQFHKLPKLQKLDLNFTARSLPSEMDFFENFSLPPSLEDLSLTLSGFTLSQFNENDGEFFERIQEAKGVRALNLKITENADNSAFTAKFICLLINCFHNLETIECHNHKESSFLFRADNAKAKPLDFVEFWTAITPSKETLQSISLNINEIIFPTDANITLDAAFPRLETLILKDSISSGTELSSFYNKTCSLRNVILRGVKLQDEERLKVFLDGLKNIPEGGDFELHLDVGNIEQKSLIDCLKKYIEDVNVKGRFEIYFRRVMIEDEEAFAEILKRVVEKGCFEMFKVTAGIRPFLIVAKREIIEAPESLGFSEAE